MVERVSQGLIPTAFILQVFSDCAFRSTPFDKEA